MKGVLAYYDLSKILPGFITKEIKFLKKCMVYKKKAKNWNSARIFNVESTHPFDNSSTADRGIP